MVYIAFAYMSLVGLGLIDNSRGPLYPQILEYFQITQAQGALVFSVSSLASFLITLPVRAWVKSLGIVRATKLALFIDVLACWGISYCGPNSMGFYFLLGFCFLFGLGVGLKTISMNLMINVAYLGAYKRRVYSGLHSMYGAASLIAPLVVGMLMTHDYEWNEIFRILSIPSLLVLIGFSQIGPIQTKMPAPGERYDFPKSLIGTLGLMLSTYVASEILVSSRLVLYLKQIYGLESEVASLYLSAFFVCLLTGRILFSVMNLAMSSLNLLRLSNTLSLCFVAIGLFYHPIGFSLTGFSMSFFFPCAVTMITEHFTNVSDYLVARCMQAVGLALVSIHYIFGLISTYYSLKIAMGLVIILLSLSLSVLVFERRLVKPWGND